jgi:hypothetical protein
VTCDMCMYAGGGGTIRAFGRFKDHKKFANKKITNGEIGVVRDRRRRRPPQPARLSRSPCRALACVVAVAGRVRLSTEATLAAPGAAAVGAFNYSWLKNKAMLCTAALSLAFRPSMPGGQFLLQPVMARPLSTNQRYSVITAKDEWGEEAPAEIGLVADELSWSSPGWLWGNPSGESYQAIKAMRMEFGERSVNSNMHRKYFLDDLHDGVGDETDWMDVKVLLAMCCMKAIETGEDDADWAGFLEDMILCRFEGDGGATDMDQLRIALSTRVKPPPPLDVPMEQLLLQAFDALKFQSRGI